MLLRRIKDGGGEGSEEGRGGSGLTRRRRRGGGGQIVAALDLWRSAADGFLLVSLFSMRKWQR